MDWGTTSPKMTRRVSVAGAEQAGTQCTNEDGGAENGGPASAQGPVEDDGQGLVGDDVAQEQRDEHPVLAVLQQPQHLLGGAALVGLARRGQDLEVDLVLSHQPARLLAVAQWRDGVGVGVGVRDGQACKDTAREHEGDGNAQIEPERRVLGGLGQLLVGERAHDAAEREGLDQRCKGVEDADEQHIDAPGARAIDAAHGGARGADGGGHSRCSTRVQWEERRLAQRNEMQ
jgi:hypothetical protein